MIGGVVVLIAVLGWIWDRSPVAAEFLTGKIERDTIRNIINATGTLQAVTTVQVGSQISGTVSALYADFNSQVRKSQIIAQLDPASYQVQVTIARANLAQARASLSEAQAGVAAAESTVQNQRAGVSNADANLAALKAQRDNAQSQLARQAALAESGINTERDVESARSNFRAEEARYQQAVAQLNQARVAERSAVESGLAQAHAQVLKAQADGRQKEAALRLAEVNLSHTTIRSPIDGAVVSRNVDVGQTLAASLSAPTLFTIAKDLTQMQVIASIDQADIGSINTSNRISFTVDAFPGRNFSGTIRQIRLNSQNVQNVVTYNAVIDAANPELKLKPGMTANLTFTIAERTQVLKISNTALRFTPQGTTSSAIGKDVKGASGTAPKREGVAATTSAVLQGPSRVVWVMGADHQPRPVSIKLGITDGVSTEVTEGDVQEGEIVIVGQNRTAAG